MLDAFSKHFHAQNSSAAAEATPHTTLSAQSTTTQSVSAQSGLRPHLVADAAHPNPPRLNSPTVNNLRTPLNSGTNGAADTLNLSEISTPDSSINGEAASAPATQSPNNDAPAKLLTLGVIAASAGGVGLLAGRMGGPLVATNRSTGPIIASLAAIALTSAAAKASSAKPQALPQEKATSSTSLAAVTPSTPESTSTQHAPETADQLSVNSEDISAGLRMLSEDSTLVKTQGTGTADAPKEGLLIISGQESLTAEASHSHPLHTHQINLAPLQETAPRNLATQNITSQNIASRITLRSNDSDQSTIPETIFVTAQTEAPSPGAAPRSPGLTVAKNDLDFEWVDADAADWEML